MLRPLRPPLQLWKALVAYGERTLASDAHHHHHVELNALMLQASWQQRRPEDSGQVRIKVDYESCSMPDRTGWRKRAFVVAVAVAVAVVVDAGLKPVGYRKQ